jgi:hypothetical protein
MSAGIHINYNHAYSPILVIDDDDDNNKSTISSTTKTPITRTRERKTGYEDVPNLDHLPPTKIDGKEYPATTLIIKFTETGIKVVSDFNLHMESMKRSNEAIRKRKREYDLYNYSDGNDSDSNHSNSNSTTTDTTTREIDRELFGTETPITRRIRPKYHIEIPRLDLTECREELDELKSEPYLPLLNTTYELNDLYCDNTPIDDSILSFLSSSS